VAEFASGEQQDTAFDRRNFRPGAVDMRGQHFLQGGGIAERLLEQ
jgi:hypothetical protein